ncbi:hypothetical protein JAK41_01550 [Stenotrophomonas maltophilia]|uniref:hypothetical protein n=1 Tax=Stenotrophomonas maltophilia TaxID=40324 RepID=UPI0021C827E5|nr:hypothetical protein [Stenotrophomonas maltophilia]MCU1156858.1 hypothetical protein [Stenotrophomonas maltophilia]
MPYLPSSVSKRALSVLAKISDINEVPEPSIQSLDEDEILSKGFSFLVVEMRGIRVLLACSRGGYKPDWIVARHLADSTSFLYDTVIVAAESLLAPERLALMSAGLSYIIIDREIFIPALGVNTSLRTPSSLLDSKLSVATQAVLIHALNAGQCRYEIYSLLSELAIPLKQIGCVSHELALVGLGAVDRVGTRSYVEMDECSITWAKVEPMLSSPIVDVLRIRPRVITRLGQMRVSDEDALPWNAHVQKELPHRLAIHRRLVKSLRRSLSPNHSKSFSEVEIWDRCPARLSPHAVTIDPISLYLCRRSQATLAELGRLRKIIIDKWVT